MSDDVAVWQTLAHIYLSVVICGVVVPTVTALGALVGFGGSFFALLGFGAVGLAASGGLVFLTTGRPDAVDRSLDVPAAADAEQAVEDR